MVETLFESLKKKFSRTSDKLEEELKEEAQQENNLDPDEKPQKKRSFFSFGRKKEEPKEEEATEQLALESGEDNSGEEVEESSLLSKETTDSEEITRDNVAEKLKNADGMIVPGGFGNRGIEGMIITIEYARVNKLPFFGICLGMQLATIEFARNVCGLKDANSIEFDEICKTPIITLMSDQSLMDMGGTQRLGNYRCELTKGTKAHKLYDKEIIEERHRHRYEFNNEYRQVLIDNGLIISGVNPERNLVEIIEIEEHPYFVACQFHPEFTSRPNRSQPLFQGLITAAYKRKYEQ